MTPQQIADQKAVHRAELERLDALEKVQRPALAAGQVWRWGARNYIATRYPDAQHVHMYCTTDAAIWSREGGFGGDDHMFEYVGLARDVLRVVPPDAGVAMKQVAPVQDEPTGAELVKRLCWVRKEEGSPWIGPAVIDQWDKEGRDGLWYMAMDKAVPGAWFIDAKLYREGVTP